MVSSGTQGQFHKVPENTCLQVAYERLMLPEEKIAGISLMQLAP